MLSRLPLFSICRYGIMLQKEMLFMAAVIFVVEDDKNIREIETFSLKNAGYI